MAQLANMAAVLGPLPRDMLEVAGPRALQFFNSDGTAKHNVPSRTLESLVDEPLKARFKLTGKHGELSADDAEGVDMGNGDCAGSAFANDASALRGSVKR